MIAQLANCAWAGMAIRDVVRKSQKRSAPIKEPEPKKTSTKRTCITLITRLSALAIGSIITAVTLFKIDFKKRNFSWPILATEMGITIAGFTIGEVLEKFLYSKANASNSNKTWIALEKISNLHSVVTGLATCFHQYAPTNLLAILSLIPFGPFIGFNASHQYRLFKKAEVKLTEESLTLPGSPQKQLTTSEKAKKIGWLIFQAIIFASGIFFCNLPGSTRSGRAIVAGSVIYQISRLIDRTPKKSDINREEIQSSKYKKVAEKIAEILRYPIFYVHLVPSAIMNYCKSYVYSPYFNLKPSTIETFMNIVYIFGGILYGPYRWSNNHHKSEDSEEKGIIRFDILVNTGAAGAAGS